jgi:energy-coupling factor transporter transmembrane protein EcfT
MKSKKMQRHELHATIVLVVIIGLVILLANTHIGEIGYGSTGSGITGSSVIDPTTPVAFLALWLLVLIILIPIEIATRKK